LRNEALEKDKIMLSLVDKLKVSEARLNAQAETNKAKVDDLRKKLAEMNENFEVAKAKQEINEWTSSRLEKNVEELRDSRERRYEKSLDCANKLKDSFAKVGAYSSEQKFIRGDPEGVIQWIGEEAKAVDEIFINRRDFCAFSGARGIETILKKARCEHVKAVAHPKSILSADNTKDPSVEASTLGGKFYSDVWMKGGCEMADEAIKKNEKESHDTREEAKQAEETAERAMIIGTFIFKRFALLFVSTFRTHHHIFITAGLSPPPEPYKPEADPVMKEALDVMQIANEVVDEVVDKLLHEAAKRVLKED
jgi:hypothetical protein